MQFLGFLPYFPTNIFISRGLFRSTMLFMASKAGNTLKIDFNSNQITDFARCHWTLYDLSLIYVITYRSLFLHYMLKTVSWSPVMFFMYLLESELVMTRGKSFFDTSVESLSTTNCIIWSPVSFYQPNNWSTCKILQNLMLLNGTKYVNNPQDSINANTTLSNFPDFFFPSSFLKVY